MTSVVSFDQDQAIHSLMEIAAMVRSGEIVGVTVVVTSNAGDVQTIRITSPSETKTALVA